VSSSSYGDNVDYGSQEFEVQVQEQDTRATVVRVRGDIGIHSCRQLGEVLNGLLARDPARIIVLAMAEVPHLGAQGYALLRDVTRRARDAGSALYLAGLSRSVYQSLNITRLIKEFTVFASVEQALEAAGSESAPPA